MFCKRTKEFLSQQGIEFEERDVSQDDAALDELQQRGLMTTPVTLIDGEVVVGFDRAKLVKLLGLDEAPDS
ncbi:MAG TPA: glutaredoxin family protein [Terriglobia bacterium]|jgi:glutaredoxin|nr:glutaredoxin family protein [Terriglobia bacterium]